MSRKLNLVTFNHADDRYIEDFIRMLCELGLRHDYEFELSDQLKSNSVNLIIDEFTGLMSNERISNFRSENPSARIIVLVTEFVTEWFGSQTFNGFGGMIESYLDRMLKIAIARYRPDLIGLKPKDILAIFAFAPLVIPLLLKFIREMVFGGWRGLKKSIWQRAYLVLRYAGFKKMHNVFDGFLVVHAAQIPQYSAAFPGLKSFGQIYPEINLQDLGDFCGEHRPRQFEISGSITGYRRWWINSINFNLKIYGIRREFKPCVSRSFDGDSTGYSVRPAFSLHPPQTASWPYCSPLRIYRSIVVDRTVPFSTRAYNQHPIENFCVQFEGLKTFKEFSIDGNGFSRYKDNLFLISEDYLAKIRTSNQSALKNVFLGSSGEAT